MKSLLTSIAASSLLASAALAQPPRYIITDLGPVGGAPGQPFFINHRDVVSGAAVLNDGFSHAVLWYKGWQFDLAQTGLGGQNSQAYVVNTRGQVVGLAETATLDPHGEDYCGFKSMGLPSRGTTCLPFVWQDGVMTPLETLGGNNGTASWINNKGEVAGWAQTAAPDPTCPPPLVLQSKPVVWGIGSIQQLPTFPGDPAGAAVSINDHGQAVGASGNCALFNPQLLFSLQPLHALLWQNGVATDLGNLGGTGNGDGNVALSINNAGQVVGNSDLPGDSTHHAFLWTKEKGMQDLGTLPGDAISAGIAINDSGQIVGVSLDADFNLHPYLWQNGSMTDLNSLVEGGSPLSLLLACSINVSGEITGLAVDTNTGEAHGYVATPKPTSFAAENAHRLTRPMILPEKVRELVRQQMRFGRFGVRLPEQR